jgi:pimeloyl-ACP methyl ester carboxylesterase
LDFSKKYEIVGDANSQEIVLIHGAGSCRRMFLPHAEELAKKGYRCILMDLPGHGARMDEALNF